MINIFISYCHKNTVFLKYIEKILQEYEDVDLHVDELELADGDSITGFMDSLKRNDLIILIITDEYLHSRNCMYELSRALETVDYKKKIFPVIGEDNIYSVLDSAEYVSYWEVQEKQIEEKIEKLQKANTEYLVHELKIIKEIQLSLNEMLQYLQDRNNTDVNNLEEALKAKLEKIRGINKKQTKTDTRKNDKDFFYRMNLNIPKSCDNTDLARKNFLSKMYSNIIISMEQMLSNLVKEQKDIQFTAEDGIYELYQNGNSFKYIALKKKKDGTFSDCITLSTEKFLGEGSYNEIYQVKYQDGRFVLEGVFAQSFARNGCFYTADEVVADIWNRFIKPSIILITDRRR